MKTYTFNANECNNTSNSINSFFRTTTDYSAMLDDIITADIVKKNSYLFGASTSVNITNSHNDSFNPKEFAKAVEFLANYKEPKNNKKLNIIIGETYFLMDGTPIIFYDDEIQIGFDTFKYSDFALSSLIENLKPSTKKIIIDIYTKTNTINIKL
ncbi:hypothetical protein [uncultured phage cr130_1]|uniref:Uncharacterized protein n=1 Tax=uncultured phage cr130_1 TaxID=2772092 RepID=A0A7M1RTL9_9CAUD|nr:hypothetical protein KNV59_gp03 [uncultured phage cr130_1]QOR57616.1 hypothetical protein [uncultured phage cr130_1]